MILRNKLEKIIEKKQRNTYRLVIQHFREIMDRVEMFALLQRKTMRNSTSVLYATLVWLQDISNFQCIRSFDQEIQTLALVYILRNDYRVSINQKKQIILGILCC